MELTASTIHYYIGFGVKLKLGKPPKYGYKAQRGEEMVRQENLDAKSCDPHPPWVIDTGLRIVVNQLS